MAADRTLTKAQKNAVFRELIALQIDPRGFEWEAAQSTYALTVDVSVLKHVVSGFYFKFDIGYCRWSPSKQGRKEEVNRHDNTWTPVIQLVKEWLSLMKPEIEEPDLWEATRSETLMSQAATAGDTDNKLLTPAERRYIVEQLRSIEEAVVKAHGLEQHQVDALNAGFQYLIDSSNRMGRKDWINLAIGTVVNIAVGAALAPAAANDLLHLLTGAFHGLVYSAVKLLASG